MLDACPWSALESQKGAVCLHVSSSKCLGSRIVWDSVPPGITTVMGTVMISCLEVFCSYQAKPEFWLFYLLHCLLVVKLLVLLSWTHSVFVKPDLSEPRSLWPLKYSTLLQRSRLSSNSEMNQLTQPWPFTACRIYGVMGSLRGVLCVAGL